MGEKEKAVKIMEEAEQMDPLISCYFTVAWQYVYVLQNDMMMRSGRRINYWKWIRKCEQLLK